jgi:hypothetical protein
MIPLNNAYLFGNIIYSGHIADVCVELILKHTFIFHMFFQIRLHTDGCLTITKKKLFFLQVIEMVVLLPFQRFVLLSFKIILCRFLTINSRNIPSQNLISKFSLF